MINYCSVWQVLLVSTYKLVLVLQGTAVMYQLACACHELHCGLALLLHAGRELLLPCLHLHMRKVPVVRGHLCLQVGYSS